MFVFLLGPVQTPYLSCAVPNTIKFDFGTAADSDTVPNYAVPNNLFYMNDIILPVPIVTITLTRNDNKNAT